MQTFTIRDIENLTGIKAHTLRIWEQRYGIFIPKRKESQRRFYDNEDLKQLLLISFLYNSGWKISRIASLSSQQITDLVKEASISEFSHPLYINQLITAAINFDEYSFVSVINHVIEKIGFEKCIVDVCYPFLTRIGYLWATNNAIPAQEHFSSYIIQNRIIVETERLNIKPNSKPEIVLFCPKGEFHELPLLFIHYLLKKNGWGTIYLGPNVKLEEIEAIVNLPNIQYLYLHLLTNFTGFETDDYFENICKKFITKNIIASGEAVQKTQRNFTNLVLLKTDQQIYDFIEQKKGR